MALFFFITILILLQLFYKWAEKDVSVFEIESKDYEEIIAAVDQMKMSDETRTIAEVSGYISYIGAGEGARPTRLQTKY